MNKHRITIKLGEAGVTVIGGCVVNIPGHDVWHVSVLMVSTENQKNGQSFQSLIKTDALKQAYAWIEKQDAQMNFDKWYSLRQHMYEHLYKVIEPKLEDKFHDEAWKVHQGILNAKAFDISWENRTKHYLAKAEREASQELLSQTLKAHKDEYYPKWWQFWKPNP